MSAGAEDPCLAIFRFMSGAGIVPDHYSVTALIKAHVKAKRLDDTVSNLIEMHHAGLSIPSTATSLIISAYGQRAQLSKAISIYEMTTEWGAQPTNITYNVLIYACAHAVDTKRDVDYLDEIRFSAK